ncbi:hypothetical protein [Janthinobacterium psychrotolerans]|uniref:hypothetical protein n=1 Tax=Janthinobacterium psychrotolerans TaxID=1747903 RepID=UPI001495EDBA|nr:hypothetical protein [Janthinobacterium psychrotolerans]
MATLLVAARIASARHCLTFIVLSPDLFIFYRQGVCLGLGAAANRGTRAEYTPGKLINQAALYIIVAEKYQHDTASMAVVLLKNSI